MFVPRAYALASGRKHEKKRNTIEQKSLVVDHISSTGSSPERGFGWRPESFHKFAPYPLDPRNTTGPTTTQSPAGRQYERTRPQSPPPVHITPADTPRSSPMPVPQRKYSHDTTPERLSLNSPDTKRMERRRSSSKHNPNAMSPAVAALLAITSIPRPKSNRRPSPTQQGKIANTMPRRMSTQQLMEYWKEEEDISGSLETGSSLDFLLSPPEREDMFPRSPSSGSLEDYLHIHSFSTESMPSLSVDHRSVLSWSLPSTPQASTRRTTRDKSFSLPKSYESVADHPLSMQSSICEEDDEDYSKYSTQSTTPNVAPEGIVRSPTSRKPSSFKSNLTASISALRSSLRSLSNFAITPYTLPEDHLSRGLFSDAQRIRSEMRPRPSLGPPTAELRRYLNPTAYSYPPSRDFHLHGSHIEHVDYEKLAVSSVGLIEQLKPGSIIALQDRIPPSTPRALLETARGDGPYQTAQDLPPQHRREIRENGEFLRICVLETNMRRAGKIEGPGRARIWLPARQVGDFESARVDNGFERQKRVPERWIAMSAT